MEDKHGVPLLEAAVGEGPGNVLENDGGSCGDVIDDGNLRDIIGVDKIFN